MCVRQFASSAIGCGERGNDDASVGKNSQRDVGDIRYVGVICIQFHPRAVKTSSLDTLARAFPKQNNRKKTIHFQFFLFLIFKSSRALSS